MCSCGITFGVSAIASITSSVNSAGCGEVNNTIDKAQSCLEAPKIVTQITADLAKYKDDPQALDKALNDGAAKLNDVADKAANTTLKEASDDLAKTLSSIDVKDVNDAADAVQKVGNDSAAYLEKVAKACGG